MKPKKTENKSKKMVILTKFENENVEDISFDEYIDKLVSRLGISKDKLKGKLVDNHKQFLQKFKGLKNDECN